MVLLQQIVVFAHLIGFAGLFGGCVAQLRSGPPPEVNLAMLWGGWVQTVTAAGLLALAVVRGPVDYVAYAVQLLVLVLAVLLVAKNRKFASIPGGLLLIIAALSLGAVAVAVFWVGSPL